MEDQQGRGARFGETAAERGAALGRAGRDPGDR
jgi:hypothetical protein